MMKLLKIVGICAGFTFGFAATNANASLLQTIVQSNTSDVLGTIAFPTATGSCSDETACSNIGFSIDIPSPFNVTYDSFLLGGTGDSLEISWAIDTATGILSSLSWTDVTADNVGGSCANLGADCVVDLQLTNGLGFLRVAAADEQDLTAGRFAVRSQQPVPAPAPLALIGLGLFAYGVGARSTRKRTR